MLENTPTRRLAWVWWVLSLLWLGGVAYLCATTWPHLSMDLAAKDPEVIQAHYEAIGQHVGWHVALGFLPVLVTLLVYRLVRRRRRAS